MDTYKEREKENLKKSLSQESGLPESIQNYFSKLKPERKRIAEWRSFESIRKDFDLGKIEEALNQILNHGLPDSGEHCHSPMTWVGKTSPNSMLETA
jgi:hypothetical protein